jgi:membrane protein YdbS with pleckstrin-like domain
MANEIGNVLNKGEKVFWDGRPKFLPFMVARVAAASLGFILFSLFMIPFFLIGLVLLTVVFPIFFILICVYVWMLYEKTWYAITNKRVLIQKGVIGRDFEMVDFDQITNAEVNVGIIDTLVGRGSGSILISTAGSFTYGRNGPIQKPYTMSNLMNPYEVFKYFKNVSFNVKTDIEYPNKYRPTTNPGYNTEYAPGKESSAAKGKKKGKQPETNKL